MSGELNSVNVQPVLRNHIGMENPPIIMKNPIMEKKIEETSRTRLNNPSSLGSVQIIQGKAKQVSRTPHPSPARAKIVRLMENTKPGQIHRDARFLADLRKNIDQYEQDLWNDPTPGVWVNHFALKIFSWFFSTNSITQKANEYYEVCRSVLKPDEERELERLEKYGGPFVGQFYANRDPDPKQPMQGFPGIVLECKEGFYNGPVEDNMPVDGAIGKMEFHDGAVYTGFFKNGKPDGENGILAMPDDKTVFFGKFTRGYIEPQAKAIKLEDGSIYQGQLKDGVPEGQGKLINITKNQLYEGEIKEGVFNGQGKLTNLLTSETYTGEFVNGLLKEKLK